MITLSEFKKAYSKAIQEGYAAIFAGAGLSKASGFVNWKELLNDLAQEIQLDVEKEPDLVEVAQYYCNEKRSRNEINEKILNRFVTESQESESIRILADLPIRVFWTTNYDHLLEDTLKKYGKRIDIKMTIESLATNLSGNDAVVYKMHGDYLDPSSCVILKDDYEIYNDKRQLFTTTLQGDLVSKTFLFIGFSFEDPNLKYILSRIRILLDKNRRTHYLFLKKILEEQGIVIEQIAALASIDVKKEERCLLEFSEKYRIPFRTYTAQELQAVPGEFHSSEFVKAQVGVDNVCERAALKAAGTGGWICLDKQAQDGMTVAIAERAVQNLQWMEE